MTAKVRVRRCPKCGYHVLRAYFKHHTCRPGDTWEHHTMTPEERASRGKR